MGTALTGLQVGSTYNGLLKTTDNAAISGTLRTITDGMGNDSALQVSTAGIGTLGTFASTCAARTSGVASYFTITAPADTGLTAATESIGLNVVGATRTWADGTVAAQREYLFQAPTYNKTTTSATFTKAATLTVSGAPTAGAGVTITNPYALWVQSGTSQFDGAINAGSNSITGGAISGTTGTFTGDITVGADIKSTGSPIVYSSNGGGAGTVQAGFQFIGPTEIRGYIGTSQKFSLTSTGLAVTGVMDINGAAASATAGHLNLGSGTQSTIGANGAASALTANPLGYIKAFLGTTAIIIPYYNA